MRSQSTELHRQAEEAARNVERLALYRLKRAAYEVLAVTGGTVSIAINRTRRHPHGRARTAR